MQCYLRCWRSRDPQTDGFYPPRSAHKRRWRKSPVGTKGLLWQDACLLNISRHKIMWKNKWRRFYGHLPAIAQYISKVWQRDHSEESDCKEGCRLLGNALMLTRGLSGPDWRSPAPEQHMTVCQKLERRSGCVLLCFCTSRKKSTAIIWNVGLIFRTVWSSFHSLATK